jgi:hypothetical protein
MLPAELAIYCKLAPEESETWIKRKEEGIHHALPNDCPS